MTEEQVAVEASKKESDAIAQLIGLLNSETSNEIADELLEVIDRQIKKRLDTEAPLKMWDVYAITANVLESLNATLERNHKAWLPEYISFMTAVHLFVAAKEYSEEQNPTHKEEEACNACSTSL